MVLATPLPDSFGHEPEVLDLGGSNVVVVVVSMGG